MFELAGLAIIIYLLAFIFWVYAFIKTLMSEFDNNTNKIIWIIALIFLPPSVILFPFIAFKQMKK